MKLSVKHIVTNKILATTAILFLVNFIILEKLSAEDKILRFEHLTIEDGLPQNTVHCIVKDKYGFMWFGTFGGLCKYDGYKFTIYKTISEVSNSIFNNRIKCLFKDIKGNIWISFLDTSSICLYNYDTDDFTRLSLKEVPTNIIDTLNRTYNSLTNEVSSNGYTWYSKRNQSDESNWYLRQINRQTGNVLIYKDNPEERWSINDKLFNCMYLDDNGILWLGGYTGGVNKADTKAKPFYNYSNKTHSAYSLIDNFIRAICEDNKGNLWVGTYKKGITEICRKNNNIKNYTHSILNNNSLIDNSIRKIYNDKYGFIWIGTKSGLDRYDPSTNHFYHYSTKSKNKIPNDWVFAITEDLTGNLWIGTFKGIAKYNRLNDSFYAYNSYGILNHESVRTIIVDDKNNLWVGTEGGGLTYIRRTNTSIINEKLQSSYYLFSKSNYNLNRVYAIAEDENGIIWAGTSGGLVRFDTVKNSFTVFADKEGLISEAIVGVLSDLKGNIWFSHKRGISNMNIHTFKIHNYTLKDGLQSLEFAEDAYFKNNKTGELFFGGINGFNSFYPESIRNNPFPPKVVITGLKILNKYVPLNKPFDNRIILTKSLTLTKSIILTHANKSIEIEFAGLHYSDPKSNKYLYILEGFDRDWISTDATKRIASYSNLEPKKYIFKIKASNNDEVWNEYPAALEIIVLPPWWQTWWFKSIILISIVLLIYTAYFLSIALYRKRQIVLTLLIKKRTQELEKTNKLLLEKQKLVLMQSEQLIATNKQLSVLNATKDRFFSIIAHDLRNPFNVVSGFSDLLIKNIEKLPKEKIMKFLEMIYISSSSGNNLLENLLQWSRSQSGRENFTPKEINILAVTEETLNLLSADAERKNISFQKDMDPNIVALADENMLKTILRNLVSNAIKFTYEKGVIILKSRIIDKMLEITVADNGVGISKENIEKLFRIDTIINTKGTAKESGTGLGLILCKDFVEKHNGKIWVESTVGKGSEFKFILPSANKRT